MIFSTTSTLSRKTKAPLIFQVSIPHPFGFLRYFATSLLNFKWGTEWLNTNYGCNVTLPCPSHRILVMPLISSTCKSRTFPSRPQLQFPTSGGGGTTEKHRSSLGPRSPLRKGTSCPCYWPLDNELRKPSVKYVESVEFSFLSKQGIL